MKIIVMGFGRIGTQVSKLLIEQQHEVTIIDHDANAGKHVDPGFKARIISGVGFDRDVLIRAGIEQAEAFVASSTSDNANIVATSSMYHAWWPGYTIRAGRKYISV
jgi:trk system potassium uptake protein TrkA